MKSMTGFAKCSCEIDGKKITVEIKTLNSKQLDLNVKVPSAYRAKDLEIRQMLGALERGKVDFLITEENNSDTESQINADMIRNRYVQIMSLAGELGANADGLLASLVRQSDVWDSNSDSEISADVWTVLQKCIHDTIEGVDEFRAHEGAILQEDFKKHVDLIEYKLSLIPQYETQRIDTAKERIHKYIEDFNIKDYDQNRFEQELIYYLEKLDITEEKVRLAKHIDYFRNTIQTEEVLGKKLGFIAQEMGREINTTGSKANHVEIQKLVVEMKDELEKIKEQLGNIL